MSVQDNVKIAKNMYDLFNQRYFERASQLVSENVVIHNMAQNIQLEGKAGFLSFMNFWITAFPDAKVEVLNQIANDEFVITEFKGTGRHDGILEIPSGNIGPTGKKINIHFCEIFHIKNNKIEWSHLYFDVATMLQQLEITPEKV